MRTARRTFLSATLAAAAAPLLSRAALGKLALGKPGSARLNGEALGRFAEAGSYLSIERRWREGDEVTVQLPMRLHLERMPDDETVQAVMYGPLVLAGRLGTAGLSAGNLRAGPTRPRAVPEFDTGPLTAPAIAAASGDPASWLEAVPGRALEFRTRGQAVPITLVPLNRIFDERYAVYWKVITPAAAA